MKITEKVENSFINSEKENQIAIQDIDVDVDRQIPINPTLSICVEKVQN